MADVSLLNASNLGNYSKLFLNGGGNLAPKYADKASDDDYNRISALGGEYLDDIDTPLEIALLSTCAGVVDVRPVMPPEIEAILPKNNPKQADLKLGATVYQEMQVLRFLGNTNAVGRHEGIIKFITDRGNVSRAEIESYLKQGIAEVVDAQFNRVSFMIDKTAQISYNAVLTRDTKTGQYTLSYERPSVANDDKVLSAPTRETLLFEMSRNSDFSQTSIDQVRKNIALMPGIRLSAKAQENIKDIIASFYVNPTGQVNYTTLVAVRALYDDTRARAIVSRDGSYELFRNVVLAYDNTLKTLNEDVARKVYDDSNITKSAAIPDIPRDQQVEFVQTVSVRQ